VPAFQIRQGQGIFCGFGGSRRSQRCATGRGRHLTPKAPHTQRECHDRKHKNRGKQTDHQIVWKQGIKTTGHRTTEQGALAQHDQHQEQGQACRQRQRHGQAIALVKRAQCGRPSVVGIGLPPHDRQGLRHIDRKLMGRRILTGMQTSAAVVAQIGQVMNVGFAEFQAPSHGGKDRAKTFAITTSVANLHLP